MDTQNIIQSQYLAALAMFEQVIVKCPAALWNAPGDKDKFGNTRKHRIGLGGDATCLTQNQKDLLTR